MFALPKLNGLSSELLIFSPGCPKSIESINSCFKFNVTG